MSFTGTCLLHRLWAFSKKGRSSQAFAFFIVSGPCPKREGLHRRSPSSQAMGLFQKGKVFTGVRLLHRLWAFSKKGRSSQAFAFFIGSGPFPKREGLHRRLPSSQALGLFQKGKVFTSVRLLHRLRAFSKKGRSSQVFAFFTGSGPF